MNKKNEMLIAIDALNLTEENWYAKYPSLIFTTTSYDYYKRLAICKYRLEKVKHS